MNYQMITDSACDLPQEMLRERNVVTVPLIVNFRGEARNDSVEDLVHSVMTNTQMWGRDLTEIEGFEALTVKNVKLIREQGAIAAYASCL